ncbi:MAG: serine/threonine protein kinase [Gammaproteobacteria bacterium]
MNKKPPPFSALTPDFILHSLDDVGLKTDGRLLALNSYENRVYQVGLDDGSSVVVKFYRPDRWTDAAILEELSFVQSLAAAEIPVVPAMKTDCGSLMHQGNGYRFCIFPKQGGRAPELAGRDVYQWVGRFIGRIHAVAAAEPFKHRPEINVESFGIEPRASLLDSGFIPVELARVYADVSAQALDIAKSCFERAGKFQNIRLHGDCYPGNMLWTDAGPHFLDFDDCRMGPSIQDLWMLLSGDRAEMSWQLTYLLEGYQTFRDFNQNELHLIEALRTLRLIYYSAWLAKRWDDPAFPRAFPWFNDVRYWQDRILELREQIALMQELPVLLA